MTRLKVNTELDCDIRYIEDRVASVLAEKLQKKIEKAIWDSFSNKLNETVDQTIDNLMENFLTKNIVVTDKWGDEKQRFENAHELLKEKFDDFITAEVDSNGKPIKGCRLGGGKSRIDFFLTKEIDREVEKLHHTIQYEGKSLAQSAYNKIKNKKAEAAQAEFLSLIKKDI